MDEIQGSDPIESKAIVFNEENGPGSVPMILTAFEEENNEALDQAGYRGRYVMFSLIDGGVSDAFTDPYESAHHMVEGEVQQLLLAVRRGWKNHGKSGIDWNELTHGESYDRTDFDAV